LHRTLAEEHMVDFLEDTKEEYSWRVVHTAVVDMAEAAVDTVEEEAYHPGACFDSAMLERLKMLCLLEP